MTRLLLGSLLLALVGCARGARPDADSTTPRYEHVFLKPLAEAMAETRKLLAERGYSFVPTDDESQLLTTWQHPTQGQWGNNSQHRFFVSGISVGPRQSVVRIFRMWRTDSTNDVEHRPKFYKFMIYYSIPLEREERNPIAQANRDRGILQATRDLALEKELTQRLESSAGIEVVAKEVAPEPERSLVRDENFYLDRWKHDRDAESAVVEPCPRDVRGLGALLRPGLTLLIGEQLGSNEAPGVVGDVVCLSAGAGHPVTLGLSLPHTEQERINHYLASPGAPADQDELLRGDFWRRPYQDGRSSRAIMDLIDRVRALRASGLLISLVAYDTESVSGSERDARQADFWLQRRKDRPQEVFIVLMGNAHARTTQGAEWDPNFTPMARRLATMGFDLVALDLSYSPDSRRWGCDLDLRGKLECTVVGADPSDRVAERAGLNPYIRLFDRLSPEGYHGLLYVGTLTPSFPATSLEQYKPPIPHPPTAPRPRRF